jgi:pimeloyl-ACP methyl ester carboxylesterase
LINGESCDHRSKSRLLTLKRYWDVEVKSDQYSWVDYTLGQGYSIFTYDRLGTGASSKPDAYDVVQTDVQVEILRQLTLLIRSGQLVTCSKKLGGANTLDRYVPSKIIHVGHSLGSIITVGLLQVNGSISDGAVLTGFIPNTKLGGANVATWGFEFARESDPRRFGDRGSGYIVQKTKYNVLLSFLKKGAFEPALLDYAEQIKQPNTVSEFISIGAVFGTPAKDFKGPVQVSHLRYSPPFLIGGFLFTNERMRLVRRRRTRLRLLPGRMLQYL